MPSFEHHGARIHYEEFGRGFPILTFAPAGLASVIDVWSQPSAPINPTTEFAADYRVIAMDQRNAGGQSRAPITAADGWDSFTADHIALLDHLRVDRCHLSLTVSPAWAQHHGGGGGHGGGGFHGGGHGGGWGGAALGLGALGALGAGSYYYGSLGYYPYYQQPAYQPTYRQCWDPNYRNYYNC
jgi:pimeloyl-ACP methyl ester carboxylesterase